MLIGYNVLISSLVLVGLISAPIFAQVPNSDLIDYYENLDAIVIKSEFKIIDENQVELFIIGIEPREFDVDKELNKIYFENSRFNDYVDYRGIIITDLSIKKIEKIIPVGKTNIGDVKINHDTKKAYVTLLNEKVIMVIDVKTDKILKIIPLKDYDIVGNPWKLTIDDTTNTIYFSYSYQEKDPLKNVGGIGIIDGNTDTIKNKIELESSPWKLTLDENTKKIFVGAWNDQTSKLLIVDLNQNKISNELILEQMRLSNLLVFENKLYVVQTSQMDLPGKILVIDIETEKIIDSFETGNDPWSIGIDSQTDRLYVTSTFPRGIQILDLKTGIILDEFNVGGIFTSPMLYDDETDTLFLAISNAIKKIHIEPKITQNEQISSDYVLYRQTSVPDFPSYSKSPEYYIQRYQTEDNYKEWIDENFPEKTIHEIVSYKTTHVDNFPDNSKSPKYYMQRYFDEIEYKEWYDGQFPKESIQNILGLSNQDMSEILTDIGKEKGRNEKYDEALRFFNLAIEYFPENPSAHTGKGYALINLIEDEKAILSFNQALKIDPNYVNATFGLADANRYLGNHNEAISLYQDGLKAQPNDVYSLAGLGLSFSELGDETAIRYLDEALDISPSNIDMLFFKGTVFFNLEKYDEAIKYYDKVLDIDPNDIDALNDKGVAYARLGDFKKAKVWYEKVLAVDPDDQIAKDNLQIVSEKLDPTLNPTEESVNQSLLKIQDLMNKAISSIEEGNENAARSYLRQATTVLENELEPLLTDPQAKAQVREQLDFLKSQLGMSDRTGGGCLIATATFGSELAPQVQMLREIRDNSLLQTQSGQSFMQGFNEFYYSFSPAIADYERENPVFKEAVKITITPLLASLSILNYVDMDSEESVLGYGIGIILMNVGMYFVAPAFVIIRMRKLAH